MIMGADLFGRWQKSTGSSGRLVRIAHFQTPRSLTDSN